MLFPDADAPSDDARVATLRLIVRSLDVDARASAPGARARLVLVLIVVLSVVVVVVVVVVIVVVARVVDRSPVRRHARDSRAKI